MVRRTFTVPAGSGGEGGGSADFPANPVNGQFLRADVTQGGSPSGAQTSWADAAGPQGPPGDPGADGADGATGPEGPQGDQGPAGSDGADGADGRTIYNGAGAPGVIPGEADGDVYIDTTSDTYYVRAGGSWGSSTSLVGPAGADGADGVQGDQGPAGNDGADGADGAQGLPGNDGADGADGANGQGVPTGGSAGQVLEKIDGTDFNTQWATPSGGGGSATQALFRATGGGGVALGTSLVAVADWTATIQDTGFTLGSSQTVTIASGLYGRRLKVTATIGGVSGNNRVQLLAQIRVNGSVLAEFPDYVARNNTQNDGAVVVQDIFVAAADANSVEIWIQRTGTTFTTSAARCRFLIEELQAAP